MSSLPLTLTPARSAIRTASWQLPAAICLLALAVRVGYGLRTGSFASEPGGDDVLFVNIAWNLANGNGYSMNGQLPTAIRPPAYPLLLAAVFALVGKSVVAARVVNMLLGALVAPLIYLVGMRLFGRREAIIASLAAAVYPFWLDNGMRVLSDTMALFLVTLALLLITILDERPHDRRLLMTTGAVLAIATLTRSELLLLLPLLCVWGWLFYGRIGIAVRRLSLLFLPVLLALGAWLARNYVVMDSVVMASNMGQVLWGVYNDDTFTRDRLMGGWQPPEPRLVNAAEFTAGRLPADGLVLPEPEYNRRQLAWALAAVREHSDRLPRMVLAKLNRLFFSPGQVQNVLRFPMIYCLCFGVLILLAGGERRHLIIYVLLLSGIGSSLIFLADERLRMTTDMVILLVASLGATEQLAVLRRRVKERSVVRAARTLGQLP